MFTWLCETLGINEEGLVQQIIGLAQVTRDEFNQWCRREASPSVSRRIGAAIAFLACEAYEKIAAADHLKFLRFLVADRRKLFQQWLDDRRDNDAALEAESKFIQEVIELLAAQYAEDRHNGRMTAERMREKKRKLEEAAEAVSLQFPSPGG